jgi:hypothetical protein
MACDQEGAKWCYPAVGVCLTQKFNAFPLGNERPWEDSRLTGHLNLCVGQLWQVCVTGKRQANVGGESAGYTVMTCTLFLSPTCYLALFCAASPVLQVLCVTPQCTILLILGK